jgi:hypothetical protein
MEEFIGQQVVLDLRGPFVCLGRLQSMTDHHFEMRNADFHDLRDTETGRENYVAASHKTGIKRNRKRILIPRAEVVGISRLEDVVES